MALLGTINYRYFTPYDENLSFAHAGGVRLGKGRDSSKSDLVLYKATVMAEACVCARPSIDIMAVRRSLSFGGGPGPRIGRTIAAAEAERQRRARRQGGRLCGRAACANTAVIPYRLVRTAAEHFPFSFALVLRWALVLFGRRPIVSTSVFV